MSSPHPRCLGPKDHSKAAFIAAASWVWYFRVSGCFCQPHSKSFLHSSLCSLPTPVLPVMGTAGSITLLCRQQLEEKTAGRGQRGHFPPCLAPPAFCQRVLPPCRSLFAEVGAMSPHTPPPQGFKAWPLPGGCNLCRAVGCSLPSPAHIILWLIFSFKALCCQERSGVQESKSERVCSLLLKKTFQASQIQCENGPKPLNPVALQPPNPTGTQCISLSIS